MSIAIVTDEWLQLRFKDFFRIFILFSQYSYFVVLFSIKTMLLDVALTEHLYNYFYSYRISKDRGIYCYQWIESDPCIWYEFIIIFVTFRHGVAFIASIEITINAKKSMNPRNWSISKIIWKVPQKWSLKESDSKRFEFLVFGFWFLFFYFDFFILSFFYISFRFSFLRFLPLQFVTKYINGLISGEFVILKLFWLFTCCFWIYYLCSFMIYLVAVYQLHYF